MSLTNGVSIARSGLSATATQTAVISRNVVAGTDVLTSRKMANIVTVPGAGVRVASVSRVSDSALLQRLLTASSSSGRQDSIVNGLTRLDITIGDTELDASPAALIGKLSDALQLYSAAPQDAAVGRSAVNAASNLVTALNEATTAVQATRQQADADIASTVDRLNTLLSQFEDLNTAIIKGTRSGTDVTDQLDQRDRLLLSISEEIGIRTATRANNDMVIYTDSGVTLFETVPRDVSFNPTLMYTAGVTGNAVYIDGVQITGLSGGMASTTGRLAGLSAVRDEIAVDYQSQLDEIARGLIETFAESDQSGGGQPDTAGLFTWSGGPAIPTSGVTVSGLAGLIRLNASVDPAQGGDPTLLRDGGIAGADYSYTTGGAGYSERIEELQNKLTEKRAFDGDAQLTTFATLADFSSSSVSWLQELRKTATSEADYTSTMYQRASEALSSATGVNLDEEMALLLELERSYEATSRLISTIDGMFRSLLEVTG